MSEAHEEYVTDQVRQWFDKEEQAGQVAEWVAYIRTGNAEAGNDPEDVRDEDIEWLSDQMDHFAYKTLVESQPEGVVRYLLSDALSEADWADLAVHYLYPEDTNG